MKNLIYLIFLLPLAVFSQQESFYSLYRYNLQVVNPAFAGSEADQMLSMLNRTQWATLADAPRTMAFAFSSKRKNNVGLGLSVIADKIFVEKQTFAYVDFSYKLDLSEKTRLFLGLKAGGNFYRSSTLNLEDYNVGVDPSQKEFSRFNPNVGAGFYLQNSNYWISFSIPRLFNVKRDLDINIGAKDRVHSYLGGGFNLTINENLYLKPSVMLRKISALPISLDLTTFLSIQNRVDFGISYRTNAALAFMAYVDVIDGIEIGYGYEVPTDVDLAGQSINTHEILLRFKLGKGYEDNPVPSPSE